MALSSIDNILWGIETALKLLLCALIFFRGLHRQLPYFAGYSVLLVAKVVTLWMIYHFLSGNPILVWCLAWGMEGATLISRALVLAELCSVTLRDLPLVWLISRWVLGIVAVIVVTFAVANASKNLASLKAVVLSAQKGLEFSIVAIVVALFALSVRYTAGLTTAEERQLAIGLAFYSVFQIINDSFMGAMMTGYFPWWNRSRIIAFSVSLSIWIIPLRHSLPPQVKGPSFLLTERAASDLLQGLLRQMRTIIEEMRRASRRFRK